MVTIQEYAKICCLSSCLRYISWDKFLNPQSSNCIQGTGYCQFQVIQDSYVVLRYGIKLSTKIHVKLALIVLDVTFLHAIKIQILLLTCQSWLTLSSTSYMLYTQATTQVIHLILTCSQWEMSTSTQKFQYYLPCKSYSSILPTVCTQPYIQTSLSSCMSFKLQFCSIVHI